MTPDRLAQLLKLAADSKEQAAPSFASTFFDQEAEVYVGESNGVLSQGETPEEALQGVRSGQSLINKVNVNRLAAAIEELTAEVEFLKGAHASVKSNHRKAVSVIAIERAKNAELQAEVERLTKCRARPDIIYKWETSLTPDVFNAEMAKLLAGEPSQIIRKLCSACREEWRMCTCEAKL
jgi:hypothetical protein